MATFLPTARRLARIGASSAALVIALASVPAFAQTDPNQSGTTPQPGSDARNADVTGNQADPNQNPAIPTSGSATTQNANTTSITNDDVVVTGTLFRRTNTETPSPVTTLSAANIDQRGLTTVADVVNSIAASNGGGLPQNFTGAFASGASSVSLRGLTTNSTLTLFDGLRAANYPLADDGQRSFVDLNTIPSAIVDRVEVLRDGASATYGADAIAGVVNVILKKEITGVSGRAEGGISERGDSAGQRLQATIGMGKLADQGYNFYISGEYQHLDSLMGNQRGFPYNTANYTSIDAGNGFTGRNGNFGAVPPSATSSSGATSAIIRPSTLTQAGNVLSGVAVPGGQFSVLQAGGCGTGLSTRTTSVGTYCEQDLYNTYGIIAPEQTRFGGTAHFTANLGSNAQFYAAATFYQSKVTIGGNPASVRSNGNPVETRGISLPAVLSNGQVNPQDPYANIIDPVTGQRESALLYYRFGDIPLSTENVARSYRFATGIDGTFGGGFGYSLAGTYMRTDLEQTRRGFIYVPGLTAAINNGTYNFTNPSANSQAVRDSISPRQQSRANSELWQIQGTITKELFQLPGGPLQVGVGGQIRYESQYDPTPVPQRDFITINPFQAVGHRYVEAGYFEINAPVLDQLEINGSGRFDHYSIGFDHFSPKIGAKFTPIKQIAFRGTYSEGFRAPSIPETSGSVIGFTNYTPSTAVQRAYGNDSYITGTYGLGQNSTGNPDVKPETSRSFTGGVVFQPKSWLSATVDYYNIRKKNLIIPGSGGGAAIADAYLLTGAIPAGVTITPNPADPQNPTLRPTPLSVNFLYSNGNVLQTSGIDAQIQATIPFSPTVKFTTILEGTEVLDYTVDDGSGTGPLQYVGTLASYQTTSASGTPRWRGNWQNTIEAGPYSLSATTYFTSGYKGYAADNNPQLDCSKAIATSAQYSNNGVNTTTGGALQCTVRHFIDVDLTGQIKVNDKFTFYFNVVNLLDAKAPFDPNTYGGTSYNPAWSSAGVVGRYYRGGATFKF